MRQKKLGTPSKATYISTGRVQADQKDIIIDKLRADAEALRKNQKQFVLLKQQYADLDRKHRAQLEQKNLQDQDFKNRHDGALRYISQLKNEAQAIKAQLRDKRLQIQDLRADQQTLKQSINERNIDIEKLRTDINALLCDSDQLQNQRIALTGQAQSLRKTNAVLSQDLTNLQRQNGGCNTRLAQLQKYLEQLLAQSGILKQKIKSYQNTNNQLDTDIQTAVNQLAQMENILYQCQKTFTQLQSANASMASNVDQFKSQSIHNQKAAQAEAMKNNDLVKKCKNVENVLRIRIGQVQQGHNQIASLTQENQNLQKINNQLSQDLEACRKHLQNLGLLNQQLINSLHNFSQQDMKAAQLINRQNRVKYLDGRVKETSSASYYSSKQTARTDTSFQSSRRKARF